MKREAKRNQGPDLSAKGLTISRKGFAFSSSPAKSSRSCEMFSKEEEERLEKVSKEEERSGWKGQIGRAFSFVKNA